MKIEKIAIVTNYNISDKLFAAAEVAQRLADKVKTLYVPDVYKERIFRGHNHKSFFTYASYDEIYSSSDLIIAIGGDGVMLEAARRATPCGIPILGINMGRLGYLSEIPADSLEKLEKLFSGEFNISERMTLDVYISKNDVTELKKRKAVNDVVVSHGKAFGISDFELNDSLGNSFSYRADGVILSTPTGSTAYSLSAGGPAIDNSLEAICVTPICAHSFFNRSILFSPNLNISVKHISENDEILYVNI